MYLCGTKYLIFSFLSNAIYFINVFINANSHFHVQLCIVKLKDFCMIIRTLYHKFESTSPYIRGQRGIKTKALHLRKNQFTNVLLYRILEYLETSVSKIIFMDKSHTLSANTNTYSLYMCVFTNIFTRVQCKEKKEEIWLSSMAKAPIPTENPKTQSDNTKTPPKTSITQRLRVD